MNKRILAFIFLSVFFVTFSYGQRHLEGDIRFGYGIMPLTYDVFDDIGCGDWWYSGGLGDRYYDVQKYKGNRYSTGSFNISHHVRVLRWMELGAVISYAGTYQNIYSAIDHQTIESDNHHSMFITPTIRFTWLNRGWVRLYSSAGFGLGMMLSSNGDDVRVGPSIQLTGFGISVGKKWFGYTEVQSVGTLGLMTFGVGYRFPTNKSVKIK